MQQQVPDVRLGERFRPIRLLGEGGYGAVYEAKDVETNRLVAVKQARRQAHDASPDMVLVVCPPLARGHSHASHSLAISPHAT